MSSAVVISFIVYSVLIFTVGIISAVRSKHTHEDFLVAGREGGGWVSGLSASASSESAWVTLGLVGEAYLLGLEVLWVIPGCLAGYVFNWLFVAERMRRVTRKTGAVSVADFLTARFPAGGSVIRILASLIMVIALTPYICGQLDGSSKIFSMMFGVEFWVGVLVALGFVLFYVVTGGFRAIAWTDFGQAILMVLGLVAMPIVLIAHVGGPEAVYNNLKLSDPKLVSLFSNKTFIWGGLGLMLGHLGIGLGYPGMPHVLMRFIAAKDSRAIRTGGVVSFIWGFLVFTGAILAGLSARCLLPECEVGYGAQLSLPIVAVTYLPGALAGIAIAAIFAAICSTADSQLLVASTSISHDLYKQVLHKRGRQPSHRHLLLVNRLCILLIVAAAALLALGGQKRLFDYILSNAWAILGAAFGPIVVLGLLWRRVGTVAAVTCMVTGAGSAVIWGSAPALQGGLKNWVAAPIIALILTVLAALIFPAGRPYRGPVGTTGNASPPTPS